RNQFSGFPRGYNRLPNVQQRLRRKILFHFARLPCGGWNAIASWTRFHLARRCQVAQRRDRERNVRPKNVREHIPDWAALSDGAGGSLKAQPNRGCVPEHSLGERFV